jgi:DNA modification methylase
MPLEITEKHLLWTWESLVENKTIESESQSYTDQQPIGYFYKADTVDSLSLLLKKWRGKFQVIYMDPPFFTGQTFQFKQRVGEEGWRGNNKYILSHQAYSDKWDSRDSFLNMLRQVLTCTYELLKPDGSIFLHLDYRFSSYARLLMDEIFGEENLLNEIIWTYKSGGRAKKHFSRKHDTILFYRKSSDHFFDIEAVGMPRGTKKRNNMKKQVDPDGRIFWSIRVNGKEYRYYEDSKIYPSDVWDDISHLQQKDPERTGYDTQKPEALLERIIKSTSRPGDWVGDFFAGSGTTLVAAQKLGRRWVGMDNGDFSLIVSRKRLLKQAQFHRRISEQSKQLSLLDQAESPYKSKPGNYCICISNPDVKYEKYKPNGRIKLEIDHSKDNETNIRLVDYICEKLPDVANYLDYIDYWSTGRIINGIFLCEQYSFRTQDRPELASTLSVSKQSSCDNENHHSQTAVCLVDIYGEQSIVVLD